MRWHQILDKLLWNISPLCLYRMNKFLQYLHCRLYLTDASVQLVPKIFYTIQVWRFRWPRIFLCRNAIVIRPVFGLALSRCKVPSLFCIIEGKVVAELRNNNSERQITNDVYQIGFSRMWYSCPHHNASATESVYFLDTVSSQPFISTFF